jgi:hypothetical protein
MRQWNASNGLDDKTVNSKMHHGEKRLSKVETWHASLCKMGSASIERGERNQNLYFLEGII